MHHIAPINQETVIFIAAVITVVLVTIAAYVKWDKPPQKKDK